MDFSLFPTQTAKRADPLIGTKFANRYEIVDLCGQGGWSSVYVARDTVDDRVVALKLLHQHLVIQEHGIARFMQEAEAAAKVVHPNMVAIYDQGVDNGRPYFVMEYVSGQTLSEHIIQNGPLGRQDFVACFSQICDALDALHKRGIVHRDIKPGNIMIKRDARGWLEVKLFDFGLAKIRSKDGQSLADFTTTGDTVGTPAYMSPEQCMGRTLDERSDIYSLGCVMYEAITGKKPFEGADHMEMMVRHMKSPPARMSEITGRPIDLSIEAIVLETMAKEPEKRPPSASVLRQTLIDSKSDDGPFTQLKVRRFYGHAGGDTRLPTGFIAGAAVACVVLVSGICLFLYLLPKPSQPVQVTQKPTNAQVTPVAPIAPVAPLPPVTPNQTKPKPTAVPQPPKVVPGVEPTTPSVVTATPVPTIIFPNPKPVVTPTPNTANTAKRPKPTAYEEALVRGTASDVWLVQGGQLHRVTVPEFNMLRKQGHPFYTFGDEEINAAPHGLDFAQLQSRPAAVPTAPTTAPSSNTQIKYDPQYENAIVRGNGQYAWLLKDGYRIRIPNQQTVNHLVAEGHPQRSMSDAVINRIARNFDMPPSGDTPLPSQPYASQYEGMMVKGTTDAVWLLEKGEMIWVPNPETITYLRNRGHRFSLYSDEGLNRIPHLRDVDFMRQR